MDANTAIPVFVAIFCGIRLFQVLRDRQSAGGWGIVFGLMLVLAGVSYFFIPRYADLISGVPFLLFVVVPLYGIRLVTTFLEKQRYTPAYLLYWLLYILHPFDHWRSGVVVSRALVLGSQGKYDDAFKLLDSYSDPEYRMIAYGRVELLRMKADWEAVLKYLERYPEHLKSDPYFIHFYMRSFGETGNPNEMLAAYQQYRDTLLKFHPVYIRGVLLFIFAFCGQRGQVARSIEDKRIPDALKKLWLATTDYVAGQEAQAHETFRQLLALDDPKTHGILQRRLTYRLPRAEDVLTPESRAVLAVAESDFVKTEESRQQTKADYARPVATYALIAANCAMFMFATISGGSEDFETLLRIGVFMPALVLYSGEWWRLLTAMFLHFGILHLAMNMLGLYVLGRFVERVLGIVRYLVIYFIAGLIPSLVLLLMAQADMISVGIIAAGASGAIMGVLGAEAAIMLRAWRNNRSAVVQQRLFWILFIIGLQVFFDLTMLSVESLFVHQCGALFGFVAASLLKHRANRVTMAPTS